MTLPTPDAYNDAVQNPRLAFEDSQLASAQVACNGFGIPKALGGGFAITYRFDNRDKVFAVRCFHKEVRDLQQRYSRIHSCLKSNSSPLFVGFEYQHDGIKIKGNKYPIVKMEWATGSTLGEYIEQNHLNIARVSKLRKEFSNLEAELSRRGIAHGDLQNGNVLVSAEGAIRLVDYDGIFVPGMTSGDGAELGHKNFQHPARSAADFSATIDRFSFLAIDLSLWAITLQPRLFRKYSNGENLLFTANDFADPSTSQLFAELKNLGNHDLCEAVKRFQSICKSPVSKVPTLKEFLNGNYTQTLNSATMTIQANQNYIAPHPVVDGSDFRAVCKHIGDKVELVGQVADVKVGSTRKHTPYVFVNFGHWRDDCVKITIWSDGLEALGYCPDESWLGQWVVVNGLVDPVYNGLTKFKNVSYRSVGITLSDRSQLHKVSEAEALWRLGRGTRPGGNNHSNANSQSKTVSKNLDILNNLKNKQQATQEAPTKPVNTDSNRKKYEVTRPSQAIRPSAQESTKGKNLEILKSLKETKAAGESSGCLTAIVFVLVLLWVFSHQ